MNGWDGTSSAFDSQNITLDMVVVCKRKGGGWHLGS